MKHYDREFVGNMVHERLSTHLSHSLRKGNAGDIAIHDKPEADRQLNIPCERRVVQEESTQN